MCVHKLLIHTIATLNCLHIQDRKNGCNTKTTSKLTAPIFLLFTNIREWQVQKVMPIENETDLIYC